MSREALERSRDPMAYFAHDANASQDVKCQRLLLRWGNEGYGAWWRMCEMLAAETGHALRMESEEDWEIVAAAIGMLGTPDDGFGRTDKCKAFIQDLLDIGLVAQDENHLISSARMNKNALYFGVQRANGARGGRPRKGERQEAK